MKPRTKKQIEVFNLHQKLPELTNAQVNYVLKNYLEHRAVALKNGKVTCLDCGHSWIDKMTLKTVIKHKCENCSADLTIFYSKKQKFQKQFYFNKIQVFEGWQVVRTFKIYAYYKAGIAMKHFIEYCSEYWINEKGHYEVVAKNYNGGYADHWSGDMEIRPMKSEFRKYDIYGIHIMPGTKVLPIVKRNGFKRIFMSPAQQIINLIINNQFQKFVKLNQLSVARYSLSNYGSRHLEHYKRSIEIATKNKYIIKDAGDYLDYLRLLVHFGKDIHSPKYVCPNNLKKEHYKYVERKRKQDELIIIKEKLKKIKRDNKSYLEQKKKYLDLIFQKDNIIIKTIPSVMEFKTIGDTLRHCIYTNDYHKKKNSLIMAAYQNDKVIETIEISLKNFEIEQARGLNNNPSNFNKEIINIVKNNMNKIIAISNISKNKKNKSLELIGN